MRRILSTGANKGIGKAMVAAALQAHDDTFVFLGSRDTNRGTDALASIVDGQPSWANRVQVLTIDVSSDASVAQAATRVGEQLGTEPAPLYAVVNNAGVGFSAGSMKEVLDVNTLGVKRVCDAFLPLVRPDGGRIVNVTSASGPNFVNSCRPDRQRVFLDNNIQWETIQSLMDECVAIDGGKQAFAAAGLGDGNSYGLSKACANAYTVLLAREHPKIHINACTPGFIETDMTRPFAQRQGKSPADMGMKPAQEGTVSTMFLLFGKLDGNGRYYGSDAKRSPMDRYRAPGTPPYDGA